MYGKLHFPSCSTDFLGSRGGGGRVISEITSKVGPGSKMEPCSNNVNRSVLLIVWTHPSTRYEITGTLSVCQFLLFVHSSPSHWFYYSSEPWLTQFGTRKRALTGCGWSDYAALGRIVESAQSSMGCSMGAGEASMLKASMRTAFLHCLCSWCLPPASSCPNFPQWHKTHPFPPKLYSSWCLSQQQRAD